MDSSESAKKQTRITPIQEAVYTHHYTDYKTILSPKNGMNIYRGCTHGCVYCDSRSACYQMKHNIMHKMSDVFGYMNRFESKTVQTSLF
ncbi:MAG: hypothetical protein FWG90_11065 [Oscillospiraceae bacterium]|nr:hypothetical protein [Oscillospiraceae bacterium]